MLSLVQSIQLWDLQCKKDLDLLKKNPEEGHEDGQRHGAQLL